MQAIDTISSASQNYFSVTSTLSFALFGALRAIETLKAFHGRTEDYRHLLHLSILAALTIVASIMPLIFSDVSNNIEICSYLFFLFSTGAYIYLLYELAKNRINLVFKKLSISLIVLTGFVILSILLNAAVYKSTLIYKLLVFWSLLVLSIKFYLAVGVVVALNEDNEVQ